tara:strand:+ start:1747 stop:2901 length:1155 start_codon:yes stop_codon:yes gene_type:complete
MKIAVLGSGTVGVMSVCHFLRYSDAEVTCVYDPNKKILGIGESSNIQLPQLLWEAIKFNPSLHGDKLDCTLKYSVYYKNWRDKSFHSQILPNQYALHFNNFKLQSFVFDECKKIYGDRFNIVEENVISLVKRIDSVNINNHKFDYVIDCRGWPESYEDYHLCDVLPLNKALVHPINKPGDWNFTYHLAHRNGWMFGIPLSTRQGWGYLFNKDITSDEEAVLDLEKILDKKINKEELNEFNFRPYRAKNFLQGRVIKNGNRAIFYEPIEALSGVVYDNINRSFFDYIHGHKSQFQVNNELNIITKAYENFICYVYHGGSIYQSKFWDYAKEVTNKGLKNNVIWDETVKVIKSNLNSTEYNLIHFPFIPYFWKKLDENLGFNLFKL